MRGYLYEMDKLLRKVAALILHGDIRGMRYASNRK